MACATVSALVTADALAAQAPARAAAPGVVPEARLDLAFGRSGGAFGGVGLFGDAGLYTRVGVVVDVGAGRAPGGGTATGARVEALARFHLDPQRASARGVYAGGGLAAAVQQRAAPRYGLVALLGVEGRPRGGAAPAVEVGLGGGIRVAAVLRRARPGRR